MKPYKNNIAKKWKITAAALLPLLIVISWQVFCRVKNLTGMHLANAADVVESMNSGIWSISQAHWNMIRTTARVLLHTLRGLGFPEGRWMELSKICWVILFTLFPILISRYSHASRRALRGTSIYVISSFLMFFSGFLFLWSTAFSGEFSSIGQWPSAWCYYLLERYFCPFTIGFLMLHIFIVQEELILCPVPRYRWKKTLCFLALALLLLMSDWPRLKDSFWHDVPQDGNGMESLLAENYWIEDLEEPHTAVVLYGIEHYPTFSHYKIQYVIAPAKLVLTQEEEMTEADFLAFLTKHCITYIVCMDVNNTVYKNAQAYMRDDWLLDVMTPYAVHWENGLPVLE